MPPAQQNFIYKTNMKTIITTLALFIAIFLGLQAQAVTIRQQFSQSQIDNHDFSNEDLDLKLVSKSVDSEMINISVSYLDLQENSGTYTVVRNQWDEQFQTEIYTDCRRENTKTQCISDLKTLIVDHFRLKATQQRDLLTELKTQSSGDITRDDIVLSDNDLN